eukprot:350654_1
MAALPPASPRGGAAAAPSSVSGKSLPQLLSEILQDAENVIENVTEIVLDARVRCSRLEGLEQFPYLRSLSLCSLGLTSLENLPPLQHLTT